MRGNVMQINNNESDCFSCVDGIFSDISSTFTDFMHRNGFYKQGTDLRPAYFPNVRVKRAEIAERKTNTGHVKFSDCMAYQESDECIMKVEALFLEKTCAGMAVGGAVGCAVGLGIGAGVGGNLVAGGLGGAAVGALTGSCFGFWLARQTKHLVLQDCEDYKEWNKARINKATQKMLREYCEMYIPHDLTCPITYTIPAFPVCIKNGSQIYEKAALEDYITNNEDKKEKLKERLIERGCSKKEIKAEIINFEASKRLPGEIDKYITKEDIVCSGEVFDRIMKYASDNFEHMNDLARQLPNDAMRKHFVALVANRNMILDAKLKDAEQMMSEYNIPDEDKAQIREHLVHSV